MTPLRSVPWRGVLESWPASSATGRWVGPVVIVLVSLLMLCWSWGTWPDVLIDFGDELYVAWRLVSGATLYQDVVHLKGPLSPYLNALWFKLFGVGIQTLVLCNFGILLGIVGLLYGLLSEISDRLAATLACMVLLTVFAYGQFVGIGNYNFICPYSHEVTHGIALSLVAISCLAAYQRRPSLVRLGSVGFALGLTFLTDGSIFLAAALTTVGGLGLMLWLERPSRPQLYCRIGVFVGSAIVPILLALFFLSRVLPMNAALHGVLGTWPYTLHEHPFSRKFYQWSMGTDDLWANVSKLMVWSGWYAVMFGPVAGLSMVLPHSRKSWMRIAGLLSLVLIAVLGLWWERIRWLDALRPLPLVMCLLGIVLFARVVGWRRHPHHAQQAVLPFLMVVFSLTLLGKMLLHARAYHYGFALTMPAALMLVVMLVGWMPAFIAQRGGSGRVFRFTVCTLLSLVVMAHLNIMRSWFAQKTFQVSTGPDRYWADARGIMVNKALEELAKRVEVAQTVAVLPEGAMLNYLSRRPNPSPFSRIGPYLFVLWDEPEVVASFQAHPPDYIALVHRDTAEDGFRFFGRDYGQRIYAWIQERYRQVRLIGAPPLQDERFGILLLQRADY